ncbi:MAG: YaaL family protein [Hungatella sp.]
MRRYSRFHKEEPNTVESLALRTEIDQTRCSIDSARNHFEQALEPTLIDCYIYELNAAQLRYQFLLRRFKSLEV